VQSAFASQTSRTKHSFKQGECRSNKSVKATMKPLSLMRRVCLEKAARLLQSMTKTLVRVASASTGCKAYTCYVCLQALWVCAQARVMGAMRMRTAHPKSSRR